VWLVLFAALAGGAGWGILSLGAGDRPVPFVDRALMALPAGLVLVTAVSFAANGPLGVKFSGLSLIVCAALTLATVAIAARIWQRKAAPRPQQSGPSLVEWALVGVAGVVLLAFAIHLAIPLMRMPIAGWDFYVYHGHFARVAYETGSLPTQVSPSYMESEYAYPPLMFLLYSDISHLLGHLSQLGPRLLPFAFTLGMALVCGRMARVALKLSVGASLCAATFGLWSGFYVYALLAENTETVNIFFFIAAIYWVVRNDIGPWPRAIGGGVLLAGAYWTKYNGLIELATVAPIVLLAILVPLRRPAWRTEVAVAAGSLLIALLLAAPHLLRNEVLFGNPAYPALARIFGGYLIDPWVIHQALPFWQPVPFFDLLPDWWRHPFRNFPETGPMLAFVVAAAPLAVARARRGEAAALQLLGGIAVYTLLYFLFLRAPNIGDPERYLLPVVALAAPLAGLAFDALMRFSLSGVWAFLSVALIINSYVRIDRQVFFSDMNRALIVLVAFAFVVTMAAFTVNLLLRPRLPAIALQVWGLRLQLLPIFALPIIGIWFATDHPCQIGYCNPFVIQNGLQQLPETAFIASHLGSSRYLTFDDRVEMLGGNPFPGDHPALEAFYTQRLDGVAGTDALKALGIRYIYWSKIFDHPLMHASPLFAELDNPALFTRIYADQGATVAIYELR
jgi:hypothetical protein